MKATGMTIALANNFINWINVKDNSEYVYYVTNTDGDSSIDMSNFGINLINEFFVNRYGYSGCSKDTWYIGTKLSGKYIYLYYNDSTYCFKPTAGYLSSDVSFRLMRKLK